MKELSSRQKQAQEMKLRIQEASFRLFNRDGFANVTMEDIASEAGCSVGNIYHYFPGKEALTTVMTERADIRYRELEEMYGDPSVSSCEKLISFCGEALVIDSGEDLLYQCIIHGIKYPEQGVLKPDCDKIYFGLLRKLIEAAAEEKGIRDCFSIEDMMNSFIVMNRGILLEWRIEEGSFDIRERGRMMARALIEGFCRR